MSHIYLLLDRKTSTVFAGGGGGGGGGRGLLNPQVGRRPSKSVIKVFFQHQ